MADTGFVDDCCDDDDTGFCADCCVVSVTSTIKDKREEVEVECGTVISDWFDSYTNGGDPSDYVIRVNGDKVSGTYEIQDGDDINVTYSKVAAG